ncbi:MAG: SRPBCC family protein [Deltaproteobacteria bacterium]|nr:SRPBCC family protein [Deltaproteobacteria bacterium]
MALIAAGLFGPVSAARAQNGAFNDTETRRLQRGELVTRAREERRGNLLLVGGTSFQVVNAPADTVWRAIRDTRAYRHYLPQVDRVRVVGTAGETETVRISHRQGPLEAAYHLRLTFSDNLQTAQFRVDPARDNDIREGWGYLRVQPYGPDRSMVTWAILADVGSGIAMGLMRAEVREWILQVPRLMRDYLGWARPRYEQ